MQVISHFVDPLGSIILVAMIVGLVWRQPLPKFAPRVVREGYPFLGMLRFFSERSRFYYRGVASSRSGCFSFRLGNHQLVGVSGAEGRKLCYESKDLSVYEGVGVFFTTIPRVTEPRGSDICDPRWASKTIIAMMKSGYLNKNLPLLVGDVRRQLQSLVVVIDRRGMLDPFGHIYKIVYQLTMRAFSAHDIADSPELLDRTRALFEQIEASYSPARILVPWLPTPAHFRRKAAGEALYTTFRNILQERRASGTRGDDVLQYLVDNGYGVSSIISFTLDTLFGGLFNSGLNAAWMFVYLACNAEWYSIVQHEVDKAVAAHQASPDQNPAEIIATLTLEQWETEFPMLDLCLRECIRLQRTGTGFRKNVSGRNVLLGKTGEVIPADAFVVYLIDEVHMDGEIYTHPEHWDPGPYLPSRAEDKKATAGMAWLGDGPQFLPRDAFCQARDGHYRGLLRSHV